MFICQLLRGGSQLPFRLLDRDPAQLPAACTYTTVVGLIVFVGSFHSGPLASLCCTRLILKVITNITFQIHRRNSRAPVPICCFRGAAAGTADLRPTKLAAQEGSLTSVLSPAAALRQSQLAPMSHEDGGYPFSPATIPVDIAAIPHQ